MKYLNNWLYRVLFLFIVASILSSCSQDEGEEVVLYDPDREPIKMCIFLSTKRESAEYGKHQWDGVRMAHQLIPAVNNTRISLILKEPEEGAGESGIADLIEQEGFCGVIYSTGAPTKNSSEPTAKNDTVSITIMTARKCMSKKSDIQILKIGSSLQDQARVAAIFAARSLGASSAAIVLDQDKRSCVLLASLFSSELIQLGGRIVNIAYINKDREEFDTIVASIEECNPDIIYMPYSEDHSLDMIESLKQKESRAYVILTNVLLEQQFLNKGKKSLDGVYMVTDYHSDATQLDRAGELKEKFDKSRKELGLLETSSALSADAYFLLVDLLENTASESHNEKAIDPITRVKSITGIVGGSSFDRLTKYMHVCQIKTGFLRHARLIYRESINPSASDFDVNIGAE
jgi:branched-chain amino acid transport system substrate-binding protein